MNLPEFTVTELAQALKRTVEQAYGYVRVRGEISQPKQHGSGHLYLRLKDTGAVVEAVCWRGTVSRLGLRPEEGMEVVCTGRLTTYPGRSQYQLIIETMALAGVGALLRLLEERKQRLMAEGLFDPARKRPLPYLPEVIGVITSPTGAVIQDILHRLADRFPRRVLLWPVAVQGEGAAQQVAAAIEGFNRLPRGGKPGVPPRPDLLIVARGGGSLEDLMPFNEEIVVRAAAASRIPLISAVGHETDTTLIDFASDRRAPTPTAAAEMAVPVRADLRAQVLGLEQRRLAALHRMLNERRVRVEGLARGLGDPRRLLEEASQRLDERCERLDLGLKSLVERRRAHLARLAAALPHPRQSVAQARNRLEAEVRALGSVTRQGLAATTARLAHAAARLTPAPLAVRAAEHARRLTDLGERLERSHGRALEGRHDRLGVLAQLLESYSYKGVLARGFVLVSDADNHPLTTVTEAKPGHTVTLTFHDGQTTATIPDSSAPAKAAPRRRAPRSVPEQGSLF